MKRALRIGLATAALGVALAVFAASDARAQVNFFGRFQGPHGQFSIGIGSPLYPVGSYAPYGAPVRYVSRYGYGFYCDGGASFVPVRRYRARWVVVEQPVVVVEHGYRDYDSGYNGHDGYDSGYSGRPEYPYSHDRYAPYGEYARPYSGGRRTKVCVGDD